MKLDNQKASQNIADLRNSLSEDIVSAKTVNSFENRLDRYQIYDYHHEYKSYTGENTCKEDSEEEQSVGR